VSGYDEFLAELAHVWRRCFEGLVPGGRLICVVGDVCLSRRQNDGRHTVVPLHASIQELCRKIGFDNLAPIIWHKIANAAYEVSGGGGFLGKPYEPNSVIKNDIEYILMFRKPGGYRKPTAAKRLLSIISAENYQSWNQQIWTGLTGASTKDHPAPYPIELAERLMRMFSFAGDVVVDPFSGSGTNAVAAARTGRHSIGYEISNKYHHMSVARVFTRNWGAFLAASGHAAGGAMSLKPKWQDRLSEAIKFFWKTRQRQSDRQGKRTGTRDSGSRTAVTGGKQLDGFVELLRDFLGEAGLDRACIYTSKKVELPGWYRAEKKWDLLIVREAKLIAAMEFKSQVGSFGNNFNNRTEEALGKCRGHLGSISRRCIRAVVTALARLCDGA
jgi:DNA modification methylase